MIYHVVENHPEGYRFLGCCDGSQELADFRREWRENGNSIHPLIIREATEAEANAWKKWSNTPTPDTFEEYQQATIELQKVVNP